MFLRTLFLSVLVSCTLVSWAAFDVPPAPNGYVLDQADVLSQETENVLESQAKILDEETSTQMVVVTIESLQGYPIEMTALEIGRGWGVGQDEFNNGLVLLVAPNDRAVRIEVGYGLEGSVTDFESKMIIEQIMLPSFREENYDQGVLAAWTRIESLARQEAFPRQEPEPGTMETFMFVLWFFFMFGGILGSILSGTKSWWLGGIIGAVLGGIVSWWIGVLIGAGLGLGVDYILSTYLYQKIGFADKSGRSRWGGGGGGGGGFGGFGGGSFGGGGASGRW